MKKFLPIVLLFGFFITACGSLPESGFTDMTAEQLYSDAMLALQKHEYSLAVKYLEALSANYPFGQYAEKGQLGLIYAYFANGDNPSAVATADTFIRLYPRAQHVDYAYYMRGVANFEQDRGLLLRYAPVDLSRRAPGTLRESYNDFNQLVTRFPNSKYTADSRQRMVYLRNFFAQHEFHVAEFYMRKKAYLAAANRANYIVQHYQQASVVPHALALMVQANRALGLKSAAKDALQVLKYNFPSAPELAALVA